MAYSLFGYQAKSLIQTWVDCLELDLTHSPSPHSLLKRVNLFPGGVPVPMMICGGKDDAIIDPHQIYGWQPWLKPPRPHLDLPRRSPFLSCYFSRASSQPNP